MCYCCSTCLWYICAIDEIEHIAKKYCLKVIYDAAHTFGETYNGKGIGTYEDVSCFSFHGTKVFNSIEGGAVCYTIGRHVIIGSTSIVLQGVSLAEGSSFGSFSFINRNSEEWSTNVGIPF